MSVMRYPPDNAREWLNRARSSLLHAHLRVEGVYLEELCFDAQQAAEKAIKAVFVQKGLVFPLTHNLPDLLSRLRGEGIEVPSHIAESKKAGSILRRSPVSECWS
jgi:HEPN domain-containing protein